MEYTLLLIFLILLSALLLVIKPKKVTRDLTPLYSSVKTKVSKTSEIEIPIHGLYVYPIRGLRSPHSVEHIDISPHGVKYDREIIIVSPETLKHVTTCNFLPMSCLSQRLIDGGKVLITTSIPERLTS